MISIYKNNIKLYTCDAFIRKKCGNKPIWVIFNGDGKPYRSNLKAVSCATHLSKIIKRIMDEENSISSIFEDKEEFSRKDFEL